MTIIIMWIYIIHHTGHYISWTTVLKVTPFSVSLSVREVSAKA